MFYCLRCKSFFEEPATKYDLHGEIDDFGPSYEAFGACPECGSEYYDEAGRCDICGGYTEGEEICDNCGELVSGIVCEMSARISDTAGKYHLNKSELLGYVLEFLEED